MTFSERFLELEGNIMIGIQHTLDADWLTMTFKVISFLSEYGWFWILLCLGLMAYKKTRRVGMICAASLLLAFILCNGVFKLTVDRMRPWEVIDGIKMMIPDPGDSSFPSGHATSAMATSFALLLATSGKLEPGQDRFVQLHRISYVLIAVALITAFARVYLGMHFPSDVLFGMFLGIMSAFIVHNVFKRTTLKNDSINSTGME